MSQTDHTGPIYIRRQSELFQTVRENSSVDTEPDNIFQQNRNKLLIEASAGTGKTFNWLIWSLVLKIKSLARNKILIKSVPFIVFILFIYLIEYK